jgi:hypothetical protein
LHPWDVERLTEPELDAYLEALDAIGEANRKQAAAARRAPRRPVTRRRR